VEKVGTARGQRSGTTGEARVPGPGCLASPLNGMTPTIYQVVKMIVEADRTAWKGSVWQREGGKGPYGWSL